MSGLKFHFELSGGIEVLRVEITRVNCLFIALIN